MTLDDVKQAIDLLRPPTFRFSELSARSRRDRLMKANVTFIALLEKVVGTQKKQQVRFLLWHLKRLQPRGAHVHAVLNDFNKLEDYSTLTRAKRKHQKRNYKIFDMTLAQISGSDDQETHRSFLNSRFNAIHSEKQDYKPLCELPSWKQARCLIEKLSSVATTKSDFEMNSYSNKCPNWNNKMMVLDIMIKVAAGSNLKDKAAALYDRLKKNYQTI